MKKAEAEKLFVEELIEAGGVNSYYFTYERGNYYYCFELNNGTRRYFTNMRDDNLAKLGIKEGLNYEE